MWYEKLGYVIRIRFCRLLTTYGQEFFWVRVVCFASRFTHFNLRLSKEEIVYNFVSLEPYSVKTTWNAIHLLAFGEMQISLKCACTHVLVISHETLAMKHALYLNTHNINWISIVLVWKLGTFMSLQKKNGPHSMMIHSSAAITVLTLNDFLMWNIFNFTLCK